MIQIPLLNGRTMPALGLGTWDLRGPACTAAVRQALALGYRHIDTAEMYGNEEAVAKGVASSGVARGGLFITTKVWTNHHRAKDFLPAAEASLKRLETDYVDLLLIHWPNLSVPLEETLGALCRLAKDGKALAVGVSNFPVELLQKSLPVAGTPLCCDQVPYSLPENQDPLLAFARPRKIAVCAYTPLGRGGFLGRPELKEAGKKHGKTPAQVALRWLVQQEGVAAIPKASGEKHLRENLEIFDFSLDAADLKVLAALRA